MVKSRTRKKFAKQQLPPDIKKEINAATEHIKQWTNRELANLHINEQRPICIPIKDGLRIGMYKLRIYPNQMCSVYNQHQELLHTFENKISAILYTIYTIKRRYRSADEILDLDTIINKNYTDMQCLKYTIDCARRRKDYVSVDIRVSRLNIAEKQLELARDKISKIHKTAKYNKVWMD